MKIFKKKETLIENLAFMAMLAAINAIFSLFAFFLPMGALFVVFLLPMVSAVAGYFCKPKYIAIYIFASIGLSFAVTFYDLSGALFYVVPSILSGTLYGLLKRIGLRNGENIFFVSLVNVAFTYLAILVIDWAFQIDMVAFIFKLAVINDGWITRSIVPSAILAISIAQASISSLIMILFLQKMEQEEKKAFSNIYPSLAFICFVSSLLFMNFYITPAYLSLVLGIYWLALSINDFFYKKHRKWLYVLLVFSFLIGLIPFYVFYQKAPTAAGLNLMSSPLLALTLVIFFENLVLFGKNNKSKIENKDAEE